MAHNTRVYCRYCGASILWMKIRDKVGLGGRTIKKVPVNYNEAIELDHTYNPKTMTKHFSTCDQYKRRKESL